MQLRILNSRFSRRIFLLFVVCIIFPMVLTFLYSYYHVGKQLDEQNFRRLHQQVRTTSLSIYERLLFLRAELNLLSSRLPLEAASQENFSKHVDDFIEGRAYERFSGILLQKESVVIPIYGKDEVQPKLSNREIEAIRDGKTVLLKQDQDGNSPSFFMVIPIVADSPGQGLLFGKISPEYLWGIGPMNALPPMTELFVLDPDQNLLISSVRIPGESIGQSGKINFRECSSQINWNYDGDDHVAACRNLFLEGQFSIPAWTVILSQSQSDIRTSLKEFKILFPLFSLLSLLVVLLISTITIRRSLEPLQELKAATREIASGKFDTKAAISSGDEFEELADDFNRMGEQLQNQFGKLKLTAEVGRLMATTMDARKLADGVLEAICRHLDFDAGFLCWHTPGSEGFVGTGSFGIKAEAEQVLLENHINKSDTLFTPGKDNIFLTGKDPLLSAAKAGSAICLPLKFADQLNGVLIVFKKSTDPVPEDMKGVLAPVTDELSVSLSSIYSFNRFLESEEKFRSIFENSAAGIALVDTRSRFVKVNLSLCRMLGYSEEEIMEKHPMEFLMPESRKSVSRLLSELRDGSKDTGFLEETYIRKDGQIAWGIFSHSLLRDRTGQPVYYISLVQDISELKKIREENKTLEHQLQHTQKMEAIGTLAGGIAHDFNNILMAIIGYTELAMMHSQETDPARPMLDQVLMASNRAAELVKQILTFSRQGVQEKQAIHLIPLVKEAVKLIRATFPAHIQIQEDYEDELKTVMADPTQIHQIVMNLCTNAHHALRKIDAGILGISVKSQAFLPDHLLQSQADQKAKDCAQWLVISVSDNGCGISPHALPRIFEPYFTTKAAGEGTGLGLSVVHGIMTKNDGFIDVRSQLGKGTNIDLFFPVHQGSNDQEKTNDHGTLSGKGRLMLVDDEEAIVDIGQKMLEKLGYEVETFTRPEKALESFRARPHAYDLVITDRNMPRMNGENLADELMTIRPDLPVLIASGFHGKKNPDAKSAVNGRLRHIQKPLKFVDLATAVRDILDSTPGE